MEEETQNRGDGWTKTSIERRAEETSDIEKRAVSMCGGGRGARGGGGTVPAVLPRVQAKEVQEESWNLSIFERTVVATNGDRKEIAKV